MTPDFSGAIPRIKPGESAPIAIPMPEEFREAARRGEVDLWNGPVVRVPEHYTREVTILICGVEAARVTIEFRVEELWWSKLWRVIRRQPLPMPDPRLEL